MTNEANLPDDLDSRLKQLDQACADAVAGSSRSVDLASQPISSPDRPAADVAEKLRELVDVTAPPPSETGRQVEELRTRWNEEWSRAAETPVVRRELASLFEVVKSVSANSADAGERLGTLLGAIRPFRWVGWMLLVIALLDSLLLLVGMEPMSPESEFKTLASLADGAAVPLIGVAMVFWGGTFRRGVWELRWLKAVSWFCLVASIGYLGAIPLGIQDTLRLHRSHNQKVGDAYETLQARVAEINQALQKADTPERLAALAGKISGKPATIQDPGQMDAVRAEVARHLARLEQEQRQSVQGKVERNTKAFWIQAAKIHIEALLAGFLFFMLWRMTDWARRVDVTRTAVMNTRNTG